MMSDSENDRPPQEDVAMEGDTTKENSPPPRLMITKMVSQIDLSDDEMTMMSISSLRQWRLGWSFSRSSTPLIVDSR